MSGSDVHALPEPQPHVCSGPVRCGQPDCGLCQPDPLNPPEIPIPADLVAQRVRELASVHAAGNPMVAALRQAAYSRRRYA